MANLLAPSAQKNVKGLLVLAGIKQIELARRLRVSRSFVSEVVAGKKRTVRIRRAIARALGVPVSVLWPSMDREAA